MKNQLIIRTALMLLFIPFLLGTTTAQKKIKLMYHLKSGDSYFYNISMDQEVSFSANGQDMTMNQEMTMKMTSVIAKEDNNYKITSSIDAITLKQSVFGMEIIYNSEDSTTFTSGMGQKLGEAFNKLIGKSYSVTIDPLGNVKDIDMSSLDENGDISENLNRSTVYAVFPDHKVAVGDSWEVETVPTIDSSMILNTKYTLKKVKGKKAVIAFESTITSSEKSESKINGTQKGELTLNRKTGWTIHSTIDQELNMEINTNGMSMPATISGTTEVESKKK